MSGSLRDSSTRPTRRKGNATATAESTNGSVAALRNGALPEDSADGRPDVIGRKTDGEDKKDRKSIVAAVAQSTLPAWLNIGIMIGLIFGGCCSNVFALEAIINSNHIHPGALITLTQFAFTALLTLPHILSFCAGPRFLFLAPRAISLRSWMIYTAFFLSVNILNNVAFAYQISVPLHIIIRSGGPVASMIIGHLYNSKNYTRTQVLAVILLTIGVVGAALADASAKGKSLDIGLNEGGPSLTTSLIGFTLLGLAMTLGAFQGVYADRLYETHGRNHWREALFYSHALSLPFFVPSYSKLLPQLKALIDSPSVLNLLPTSSILTNTTSATASATATRFYSALHSLPAKSPVLVRILSQTPIKVVYLIINALTQYVCIRGVHLLSAKSSSLTVTVVLNIRKLVSLILSVYVFGNVLTGGVMLGAVLVFVGGGLYGYEGARLRRAAMKNKGKNE
ncbi:hypothetical protein AJ79_03861 [Helicocarpus griseus UAMH5409]|uniref:UAA transporter n=1 Tax=Helicocarpus griseus UAMH5409 TaxID=1447875 RepID=A0A2B7XN06_9EURO|nr:hypothetical protein AJ79_03861 [Helicocarpus griseus UAMH5409]